jgi:(1->4)-alpha-D-glucan 1-alpha-D-glucosylmutase
VTTLPTATYRVQLRAGFGFAQAAQIAPYLAELGISHVYFSPYLQAAPGSTHGYDVVDPTRVDRELGGEVEHARMVAALHANGLSQVIDVVPNHMAIATPHNRYWWDVLEHGPSSRYAAYFDIDWRPPDTRLHDKVLMPILGDHYGRVLESGAIRVQREGARFTLRVYDEHVLPMDPGSIGALLERACARAASDELGFVASALRGLPRPAEATAGSVERRYRDAAVLGRTLNALLAGSADLAAAVDAAIAEINADADLLGELIELQSYRLAYWRLARHDLDYRRFFDIDTLAAVRVERAEVWGDLHALVLRWVESGEVAGLRIDHPDGLRDPLGYLQRLRERAPSAWIVVEKILTGDETLPRDWPVHGTTGYDFVRMLAGLFTDPDGEPALSALQRELTGAPGDFAALARDRKRFVLDELLGSDLERLTSLLAELCEHNPRFCDYSRSELRAGLREMIACLPVYRTYVRGGEPASERDLGYLAEALACAERAEPPIDRRLLSLIARIARGELPGPRERELAARIQQLSAATMAKGVEDTAFYNYPRLLAHNEVGCDPGRFALSIDDFHAHCARIAREHPATLLASSTHDTKRSEDVRVRIGLLSEIPARWAEAVRSWSERARRHRVGAFPDAELEYALFQTLVGAHPIEEARLTGYLQKAMREAKAHSSWHRPNEDYERAVLAFARGVLGDVELMAEIARFVQALAAPARVTSLAQLALKLTAPGVPDIYQGNELFRRDLTDPDNRRPVDFARLHRLLRRVSALDARAVLEQSDPDLQKLFVTHRLLRLRKALPDAFGARAGYRPLAVSGRRCQHAVAFVRGERVTVVVPRLVLRCGGDFGDARIALPGALEHALTGTRWRGEVALAELFAAFPVAVLRPADD